jgi:hypothetical protein
VCSGGINLGGEGPKAKRLQLQTQGIGSGRPCTAIHWREPIGQSVDISDIRIRVRGASPDPVEGLINAMYLPLAGDGIVSIRDIAVDSDVAIARIVDFDWNGGLNGSVKMRLDDIVYVGPGTPALYVDVDAAGSAMLLVRQSNNWGVLLTTVGDVTVVP